MYALRLPLWGAALGLLLPACEYEVTPDVPDASGPFVGNVSLIWAPTSYAVTADFTTQQFASSLQLFQLPDSSCVGSVVGSCCVYSQPLIDIPMGGVEPLTVSAGTIAIADTADGGFRLLGAASFSGLGYTPISSAETPTLLWNPGDTLSVAATGGLVSGFAASITAPPPFTGVSPALTLTDQIVVPLTTDFTVNWTPGPSAAAGGSVTAHIFDPAGTYIDCTALDSAGIVTAPAASFAGILQGDNGYVTLYRASSQTLTSAGQTITLSAEATDPGLATFQ